MDKISYYNITVTHQDYRLMYNTLSNSLICFTSHEFVLIEEQFKNLKLFREQYPLLYDGLKKSGFIIEDYDELEYVKFNNKLCVFASRMYHLTINPTLDCNLKCWYCSTEYANAQHHGGMKTDIINAVMKHIVRLIEKSKIPALHLDWFGGEPLLYYKEVFRPISALSLKLTKDHNVNYSQHITTNATLMTEQMIKDMMELHFNSFQIPIDGNEQHHNAIKFGVNKAKTFKSVVKNINLLADIIPNVNIILRINYDKKTLYGIEDIIPYISNNAKKHITVDFQKVWQIDCNNEDINQLEKIKNIFRDNGLKSGYWAYTPKQFNRCYADKLHQYSINYDGRIFKCTAQDYGDDKVIGLLKSDGSVEWKDKLLSELFSYSTFENEKCLKCKSLPICMGPCNKEL